MLNFHIETIPRDKGKIEDEILILKGNLITAKNLSALFRNPKVSSRKITRLELHDCRFDPSSLTGFLQPPDKIGDFSEIAFANVDFQTIDLIVDYLRTHTVRSNLVPTKLHTLEIYNPIINPAISQPLWHMDPSCSSGTLGFVYSQDHIKTCLAVLSNPPLNIKKLKIYISSFDREFILSLTRLTFIRQIALCFDSENQALFSSLKMLIDNCATKAKFTLIELKNNYSQTSAGIVPPAKLVQTALIQQKQPTTQSPVPTATPKLRVSTIKLDQIDGYQKLLEQTASVQAQPKLRGPIAESDELIPTEPVILTEISMELRLALDRLGFNDVNEENFSSLLKGNVRQKLQTFKQSVALETEHDPLEINDLEACCKLICNEIDDQNQMRALSHSMQWIKTHAKPTVLEEKLPSPIPPTLSKKDSDENALNFISNFDHSKTFKHENNFNNINLLIEKIFEKYAIPPHYHIIYAISGIHPKILKSYCQDNLRLPIQFDLIRVIQKIITEFPMHVADLRLVEPHNYPQEAFSYSEQVETNLIYYTLWFVANLKIPDTKKHMLLPGLFTKSALNSYRPEFPPYNRARTDDFVLTTVEAYNDLYISSFEPSLALTQDEAKGSGFEFLTLPSSETSNPDEKPELKMVPAVLTATRKSPTTLFKELSEVIIERINTFNAKNLAKKKIFDKFISAINKYHGQFVIYLVKEDCETISTLINETMESMDSSAENFEILRQEIKKFLILFNVVGCENAITISSQKATLSISSENSTKFKLTKSTKDKEIQELIKIQIAENKNAIALEKPVNHRIDKTLTTSLVYLQTYSLISQPSPEIPDQEAPIKYLLGCHLEFPTGFRPKKTKEGNLKATEVLARLVLIQQQETQITGLYDLAHINDDMEESETARQLFNDLPTHIKEIFKKPSENRVARENFSLSNHITQVQIPADSFQLQQLIVASKNTMENDEPRLYLLLPPQKFKNNKNKAVKITKKSKSGPVADSTEVTAAKLKPVSLFKSKSKRSVQAIGEEAESLKKARVTQTDKSETSSEEAPVFTLSNFLAKLNSNYRKTVKSNLAEAKIKLKLNEFPQFAPYNLVPLSLEEQQIVTNYQNLAMRPDQQQGVMKLIEVSKAGKGIVLGDTMGMGKTIQAGYFIKYHLEENDSNKLILVVLPKAVLDKWHTELVDKCGVPPNLIIRYFGPSRDRSLSNTNTNAVVLTTYDTFHNDLNLAKPSFMKRVCSYLSLSDLDEIDGEEKQISKNTLTKRPAVIIFNFLASKERKILSKKGAILKLPTDKQLDLLYKSYPQLTIPREKLQLLIQQIYTGFRIGGIIFDECHTIKDARQNILLPITRRLGREKGFRVGLTGTLYQNNLKEFWNVHHLLNPDEMGTLKEIEGADNSLKRELENQIKVLLAITDPQKYQETLIAAKIKFSEVFAKYKKIASEFSKRQLRRKVAVHAVPTSDNTEEDPSVVQKRNKKHKRIDQDCAWELVPRQKELFDKLGDKDISKAFRGFVNDTSTSPESIEADPAENATASKQKRGLELFKYINKFCFHPILVDAEASQFFFSKKNHTLSDMIDYLKEIIEKKYNNNLDEFINESGKVKALVELIQTKMADPKPKILITTSMIATAAIIQLIIQQKFPNAKPLVYYGVCNLTERTKIIDEFNNPNSGHAVVTLSQGAGGVGIELLANTVFCAELFWNSATRDQVTGRADRDSNKHDEVKIYHAVGNNPLDKKMLKFAEEKNQWSHLFFDNDQLCNETWFMERIKNHLNLYNDYKLPELDKVFIDITNAGTTSPAPEVRETPRTVSNSPPGTFFLKRKSPPAASSTTVTTDAPTMKK